MLGAGVMRLLRIWLPLAFACTLVLSCAGAARAQVEGENADATLVDSTGSDSAWSTPDFTPPVVINGLDPRLDSIVRPWLGTKHRYGKQSKDGIDCSGFVQVILQEYLNYKTARSSAKNYLQGDTVLKSELLPGDVVFFSNHKRTIDHSGVWIGNGRFAHSSTSSGVIVTELDKDHYWSTHYKGARRYVINPAFPPPDVLPEFSDTPKDTTP